MGTTNNGIEFEEIRPPSFSVGTDGLTATRTLKIAWEDIDRFMLEMFPSGSSTSGGNVVPNTGRFPGRPYLKIQNVRFDPFDEEFPDTNDANGVATCPSGAVVTLEYGTTDSREGDEQDNPTDADGTTIISQNVSISGEYLMLPAKGLKWELESFNGDEENQFEDLQVPKLIPTIEYVVTLHRVPELPLDIIVSKIGRVNLNHEHRFNAPPETLLYVGCNAKMNITTEGAEAWEIEHRFLQRVIWVANTEPPYKGWNHFLHPGHGVWLKIQTKASGYVYNTVDNFDALFFPDADAEFSSSQSVF